MVKKKRKKDKTSYWSLFLSRFVSFFSSSRFFLFFKNFLSSKSTVIIRSFLVIFFVVVFFVSATFLFQFRSNYAEQIVLEVRPQYNFLELRSGDKANVSIVLDLRASFFCQANCSYRVRDLGSNRVLSENYFDFFAFKKYVFNENFSTTSLGYGQELYLFEVECNTLESRFCVKSKRPITRTSLVSLNYRPSLEQEMKKEEVIMISDDLVDSFVASQSRLLNSEAKISSLSSMKKNELNFRFLELSFFENILKNEFINLNEVWESQDYILTYEFIRNNNLIDKIVFFEEKSKDLVDFINYEVYLFNSMVSLLRDLDEVVPFIKELERAFVLAGGELGDVNVNILEKKAFSLKNYLDNESFSFYGELEDLFLSLNETKSYLEKYYYDFLIEESYSFLDAMVLVELAKNDLCLFSEIRDCNTKISFEERLFFDNTIRDVNDISVVLGFADDLCGVISGVSARFVDVLGVQRIVRENLSSDELFKVDTEKSLVESSMLSWQIEQAEDAVLRSVLVDFFDLYGNSSFFDTQYYPLFYDVNLSDYFLPSESLFEEVSSLNLSCLIEDFDLGSDLQKEKLLEADLRAPNISILNEVVPVCCFDSVCDACCDFKECIISVRNPLILLHGYSFYSFNSAFHSTDAFNDFVSFLLNESLYVPAGIIGPSFFPQFVEGDLLRSRVPPVFKATYYDVLSFEEIAPGQLNVGGRSIMDYADNLHEIIEFVKIVTGKDKVDLVAHSMGGLVSRVYMHEYGSSSLDKVIFVGTPNKGVPGRLLHLCKFFGGLSECDEMYRGSVFINFLNTEANYSSKKVHMIIGEGCNTFGEDGDGIVQSKSAYLDFAENHFFKGSCDLIDNFHRDMIKPSKYPEIYDKILEIIFS